MSEALGPNQLPTGGKVIKLDVTKGFWKWVYKLFHLDRLANRMAAESKAAQAYAIEHNFTFEEYTQQVLTGLDNIGSAFMASGGGGLFYYHIAGEKDGESLELSTWFREQQYDPNEVASPLVAGAITPNQPGTIQKRVEVATILAGRITIPESVPSLLMASRAGGLFVADPGLFQAFGNSGQAVLEGDFNQYFAAYAPLGNKVSAFESLPPNVMTTLIDEFSGYCIEFVGRSVYLFGLTDTNRKGLSGSDKPVFVPENVDAMIAKLQRLAGFFHRVTPTTNIGSQDIITEKKPVFTIKL